MELEPENPSNVMMELLKKYPTDQSKSAFLTSIRGAFEGGYMPCRKGPNNSSHRYHIVSKKPLRFRCYLNSCKDNLRIEEAMLWIAHLITIGRIRRGQVGLSDTGIGPIVSTNYTRRKGIPFAIPSVANLNRIRISPAWYSTKWTPADGNCMFTAFGRAVGGHQLDSSITRAKAVKWMANHQSDLESFLAADIDTTIQSIDQYISHMSQRGTWGDALALHSLCMCYHVYVRILKRDDSDHLIWLSAGDSSFEKVIYLYLSGKHYENLIRAADVAGL